MSVDKAVNIEHFIAVHEPSHSIVGYYKTYPRAYQEITREVEAGEVQTELHEYEIHVVTMVYHLNSGSKTIEADAKDTREVINFEEEKDGEVGIATED